MRIAAIDIGSNSVRLTIVQVAGDRTRTTLDEEKAYVRLGRGLAATGRLDDAAINDAVAALERMLQIARGFDVTLIRAVATAAVRTAANGAVFVARLQTELGLDVEVITGEHEGRLALLSAIDGLALDGDIAVVDIGGGSVEIVRARDDSVQSTVSVPLGAVVLSDRFGNRDPLSKADARRLGAYVTETLAASLGTGAAAPDVMVGSGGTVTALAALAAAERDPGLVSMHGYVIGADVLAGLRAKLVRSTARERSAMRGMSASRVDIIAAGAVVLDEARRALGARGVVVNAHGMRAGIIIEAIEREWGSSAPVDRMRSVRDFGRMCRADVRHAEHVRHLALSLFDQLAAALGIDSVLRPLLEAAALLHDVGHLIAFEGHHKHGYHLISCAELPGFSPAEVGMIAAIARYHAGSLPKSRHETMRSFSSAERRHVAELASLLRIADGLDRSRAQRVERVTAHLGPSVVTMVVQGEPPLGAELHDALVKTDLFERTFETPVAISGPAARGEA